MRLTMDCTIFLAIVFSNIIVAQAYWCTRSKSEDMIQQVTVMQKCNQTYEDSCSFFSWDTCTYNELVDCPVKKNITVTRYLTVEECCPGYKLDPINNITCIPTSATVKRPGSIRPPGSVKPRGLMKPPILYKSGVTVSELDKDLIENVASETGSKYVFGSTSSRIGGDDDGWNSGLHTGQVAVGDDDNTFLGLSHGAYAGIICSLLFILCVCVLIILHVRKRARKERAKGKPVSMVEVDTTQKMLSAQA